ncbi:hypothetical protein Hanom_Chr10g00964731 [Helianthus anomalus]
MISTCAPKSIKLQYMMHLTKKNDTSNLRLDGMEVCPPSSPILRPFLPPSVPCCGVLTHIYTYNIYIYIRIIPPSPFPYLHPLCLILMPIVRGGPSSKGGPSPYRIA